MKAKVHEETDDNITVCTYPVPLLKHSCSHNCLFHEQVILTALVLPLIIVIFILTSVTLIQKSLAKKEHH